MPHIPEEVRHTPAGGRMPGLHNLVGDLYKPAAELSKPAEDNCCYTPVVQMNTPAGDNCCHTPVVAVGNCCIPVADSCYTAVPLMFALRRRSMPTLP